MFVVVCVNGVVWMFVLCFMLSVVCVCFVHLFVYVVDVCCCRFV